MRKWILILVLVLGLCNFAGAQDPAQLRALYVPSFSTNTQSECDDVIDDVLNTNINAVFVQVRSRGDAFYYPNREDSTYPNPEPRGETYSISPSDLDVLQYYIDRLHTAAPAVEVHAWLTTYNSWNRSFNPSDPDHVYLAHPEWITEASSDATFTWEDDAPLDPGIPAVQDYLYNVFMDVVRNYDIDGIHFDYIRLFSSDSGYDPVALAQFQAETGFTYNPTSPGALSEVYEAWRRDQISQLVQRVYEQTMLEKPWVEVSAFLVNFTDSVETLGQGYNWWVAHEKIDVLHPSVYSTTVSGAEARYNQTVSKLAQNGDENKRPLVPALGSYLVVDSGGVYDPPRHLNMINTLLGNSRVPDGFNCFAWQGVFVDGEAPDPDDVLAQDMFNSGGPFDDWAPVIPMAHKTEEETTAPNPPASLSATLSSGVAQITFSRPAAAGDGDLPVHYRLYRDTSLPVDLYYDNMVMEWWDLDSSRSSFSFDDVASGAGTFYYAAVAYDDWNNQAVATSSSITVSGGYIIETRSGGQNVGNYNETSGSFLDSSAHSNAPGCTSGIGSRFATPGTDGSSRNDAARFTPSGLSTGQYEVYVTTFDVSSANAQDVTVRVNDSGGVSTSTFDLVWTTTGDAWVKVADMDFVSGQGHYVEFDNATQSNFGDSTNSRMNMAALRFVKVPEAKEAKPAVTDPGSLETEVIVDSEPTSLDYDDADVSSAWQTTNYSPSGTFYGGSARYYDDDNFPFDDYAVYVVDLPQSGQWAIDGWIREEQGALAQGVQFRFVDSSGTVRNNSTTLRTGASGWTVDVDGVDDSNAYTFNEGRVYVTIYGNTTGGELLIADALRFRYIISPVSHWHSY